MAEIQEIVAEKFIIDCDAGTDDALALLLALGKKTVGDDVDVLGITCVGGNTTLDCVVKNVLKTLKIAGREEIPVYKGATCGVIPQFVRPKKSYIHGEDGLGLASELVVIGDDRVEAVERRANAVDWLGRTVMEHPAGSITLLTLGPLTNVAFAHRLYPHFHARLKRLVVMGGSLNARGNMGLTSEFNFDCDVEAAHAVVQEFACPMRMITFDICAIHYFPFDWYERILGASNSIKAKFVRAMFQTKVDFQKSPACTSGALGFFAPDWLAAACAMRFDQVVRNTVHHQCVVELNGTFTRGQSVIDWRDALVTKTNERKIEFVTEIDMDKLKELFEKTLL